MSDRRREPTSEIRGTVRDPARVAAVRRTGLLDSRPEEIFDRLTRLASRLVGAPAAFIALVDEARDFYKSTYGFGQPLASSRELTGLTFCHYAVAGCDALVIPDTRAHPVYSQVPTVETLGVAAYLGIPLVTSEGHAVGSFCVVDFQPREWRDLDVEVVRELAESTLREIELRLALRDAQAAHARADELTRARKAVIGMLSHDLRGPVDAVRSSASSLLEASVADEERRAALEVIRRSADALKALVADVVEIADLEGKGLRLDPAVADPAALIEEAVAPQQRAAALRGLELSVAVPADLPPVLADRSRICHVVTKLVGDAIRAAPAGTRVTVRATPTEGGIAVSVSDARRADSPQGATRMVEHSRTAPGAHPSGTGLTLAIVDSIVRAHGGAISVESTPGGGTTFSFTIPAAPKDMAREAARKGRPDDNVRPAT